MSTQAEIRRVSYADILGAVDAQALLRAYAAECLVPVDPQIEMYRAMEAAGNVQAFGVYADGRLVGLASVLSGIMPHNGRRLATAESIFILPEYRAGGAGDRLLDEMERYAAEIGCTAIQYMARVRSEFDRVLQYRLGCGHTHNAHTRYL